MTKATQQKLLIFGSGFISRFIASAALHDGMKPIVLYNQHPLENLDEVEQVCLSSCDVSTFIADSRPSYIIALQGSSFMPDNKYLVHSLHNNLMKTILFMEEVMALMESGEISPEKIVFTGSSTEYGRSYADAILETYPLHPTSIYGLTKIYLYNAAMYYYEKGLPIVYARQFNCTGPYQRADFVVPSICRQIAQIEQGQKDHIAIGDTSQKRDFVDVRDAAQAYMFLLKQGAIGDVYNIGSGNAVSISEVLDRAICFARSSSRIDIKTDSKLFFTNNAISNIICANTTKLFLLGFRPRFTLDDTIKDILEFWRRRI